MYPWMCRVCYVLGQYCINSGFGKCGLCEMGSYMPTRNHERPVLGGLPVLYPFHEVNEPPHPSEGSNSRWLCPRCVCPRVTQGCDGYKGRMFPATRLQCICGAEKSSGWEVAPADMRSNAYDHSVMQEHLQRIDDDDDDGKFSYRSLADSIEMPYTDEAIQALSQMGLS